MTKHLLETRKTSRVRIVIKKMQEFLKLFLMAAEIAFKIGEGENIERQRKTQIKEIKQYFVSDT